MQSQLKGCLCLDGENISRRKKHKYYGQVQMGMAVLNLNLCYFVIYSSFDKNLFVLRIMRDDSFIVDMLTSLSKAFIKSIIHEICINYDKYDNVKKLK